MKLQRLGNSDFLRKISDRIEGDKIILYEGGHFPKKIIIIGPRESREYELRRTLNGRYQIL